MSRIQRTPSPDRSLFGRLRLERFRRWLAPVGLLMIWQLASESGLISTRVLAAPATVIEAGWALIASGELSTHLWVSLGRVVRGLAIGAGLGLVLGLVAGLFRWGEDLIDPPLQMFRTLPVLALVPLFILWFGIGETPKVALVALGSLFPVYLNVYAGIRGIDARLVEAASSLSLGRAALIGHVILPGALPSALVGFRYALGVAWLVLVVSEQINAESGIGYLMTNAREFMRTDVIVVGLVVYALLGLLTDALVRLVERRVLGWRSVFAGQ